MRRGFASCLVTASGGVGRRGGKREGRDDEARCGWMSRVTVESVVADEVSLYVIVDSVSVVSVVADEAMLVYVAVDSVSVVSVVDEADLLYVIVDSVSVVSELEAADGSGVASRARFFPWRWCPDVEW